MAVGAMWTSKADIPGEEQDFSQVLALLLLQFFFQLTEDSYIRLSVRIF